MADSERPGEHQSEGDTQGVTTLNFGAKYGSFEQLETAIKRYEEVNYVTLYRRSSRTIEAARKRAPNRHFSEKLLYYEMDLACVHGGREYVSKSKEKQKQQRYANHIIVVVGSIGSMHASSV